MKGKNKLLFGLAFMASIPISMAQSLAEQEFDLSDDRVYTTTEFINDGTTEGHILVSSTKGIPSNENTIIERVDNEGGLVWSKEYYPPAGSVSFDRDLLIKNKRAGFNPDNGRIIVVGQVFNASHHRPGYIELDPTNGDVLNESYFTYSTPLGIFNGDGYINAINTVESGTYAGAYMVGKMEVYGKWVNALNAPLLIKRGTTSDFANVYDIDAHTGLYAYLDVDVDEYEGNIVCVGFAGGSGNNQAFGTSMIVDVMDQSGNIMYKHSYSSFGGTCRFTSVKMIGLNKALVAGSNDGQGLIMEINIISGAINWARTPSPGDFLDGTANPFSVLGEIIEVELDNEAMPVIMGIETPHGGLGQDPVGPGLYARLNNNGQNSYAIYEAMPVGYGDLEPQPTSVGIFSGVDFLVTLTGENLTGISSILGYHKSNNSHSSCADDINLSMDINRNVVRNDGRSKIKTVLTEYDNSDANFSDIPIIVADGCCQLPYFNPLPWNHPWQTTYWSSGPANIDAGAGFAIYNWDVKSMTDIYSGSDLLGYSPILASPTITQILNLPFKNTSPSIGTIVPYSGGPTIFSAQRSRVDIEVWDNDGCSGWDATYVQIAEDGYHNRPDYTDPNNWRKYEKYAYCETSTTSPTRHVYEHKGWNLSSGGFVINSVPITGPDNILNTSGNPLLSTVGVIDNSEETVYDNFQKTHTNLVQTDIRVMDNITECGSCTYPTSSVSIEEYDDDNRKYYTIDIRDAKIVKFAFSIHMQDISIPYTDPDVFKMVKRNEMYMPSSGATIEPEDFLLPTVDDRYLKGNSLYTGFQPFYLDVWYTSSTSYPYVICGHDRFSISAPVARKANPNGGSNTSTGGENEGEGDLVNSINDVYPDFMIYPNPSNGLFQMNGLPEQAQVTVLDIQGRIVQHFVNTDQNAGIQQIDIQDRPDGLYFIEIRTVKGEIFAEKLIKQ